MLPVVAHAVDPQAPPAPSLPRRAQEMMEAAQSVGSALIKQLDAYVPSALAAMNM